MLSFVIFAWELLGVSFQALLLYAFVYTVVAEGRTDTLNGGTSEKSKPVPGMQHHGLGKKRAHVRLRFRVHHRKKALQPW